MRRLLIATLLILAIFSASHPIADASVDWIRLHSQQDRGRYVDAANRTVIFHGVNVVFKEPPWLPPYEPFDAQLSFGRDDIDKLKQWGFNVIRLGAMWPGIEPSLGDYNTTYLSQVKALVRELAAHGIHTIIDVHQDLALPQMCGEGFPSHVYTQLHAEGIFQGLPRFPEPIGRPYDHPADLPSMEQCLSRPFFLYYLTYQVNTFFQALYDNRSGIRDSFASFWRQIARALKDEPGVLAYELINEPWGGSVYEHPWLVYDAARADRLHLTPLYQHAARAVREEDGAHILMFEKFISSIHCGFEKNPLNLTDDDVGSSYAFHVYCLPSGDSPSRFQQFACDLAWDILVDGVEQDLKKIGYKATGKGLSAGFMTEFGAVRGTAAALEMVSPLLDMADERGMSWAYWAYKYFNDFTTQESRQGFYDERGQLEELKLKYLSRTYPMRTAGEISSYHFSPVNGHFTFTWFPDHSIQSSHPTIVYVNRPLHYPRGLHISCTHKNPSRRRPHTIHIEESTDDPNLLLIYSKPVTKTKSKRRTERLERFTLTLSESDELFVETEEPSQPAKRRPHVLGFLLRIPRYIVRVCKASWRWLMRHVMHKPGGGGGGRPLPSRREAVQVQIWPVGEDHLEELIEEQGEGAKGVEKASEEMKDEQWVWVGS
ncbi:unnamed protein product [Vitrella brassicaformis CCMP3155]|uniref:Glycoside hydrolase family 5 domain-containing protein n=2 Tax=Vitrella brassicaformis TaxID=1169539 RepID=A0A0G4G9J9_VITBC|nr:unnamed protein product [Vitrella brassicaformis CCMP3155]|eukprot:CEM25499.1 unnamed protein product [Vitrella brassicaformis CCMP3155]